MNLKLTITLAVSLLLGVFTLLWWQNKGFQSSASSSDSPELSDSRMNTRSNTRTRTSTKPTPSKFSSLTNDSLSEQTRLNLARRIDTDLTPAEIDILLASFTHTPPTHSDEIWYLILNEIMEQMRKKGVAPRRLGPALAALITDAAQPEVVRDYAVQHLSQWIAPVSPDSPHEPSTENAADALHAIATTITDPSIAYTSIPGTSLMALTDATSHLPQTLTAPMWSQLDPVLTSILKGETHGTLATRTTIIQTSALRGNTSHLPLIRTFAHDAQANPSIRLSSIAALGIYADTADRTFLTEIAAGSTRYRYAAQSALKKLSN